MTVRTESDAVPAKKSKPARTSVPVHVPATITTADVSSTHWDSLIDVYASDQDLFDEERDIADVFLPGQPGW